jgi:hypothetical protein
LGWSFRNNEQPIPEQQLAKDENAVRHDPAGIMTEAGRRFNLDTRRPFRFA